MKKIFQGLEPVCIGLKRDNKIFFSFQAFLAKFGYLTGPSRETGNLMSKDDFIKALKNLQRWGHIPQTGVIDRRTLELMSKPRCGVRDEDNNRMLTRRRKKRYITAPSKWEKKDLTFR